MKGVVAGLILMLLSGMAVAQNGKMKSVKGIVADSISGKPLEFATITIFEKGNKTPANGTITDKTGEYLLGDLKEGTYTILLECLGYKSVTLNDIVIDKAADVLDLKKQSLFRSNVTMDAVTVNAATKIIDNRIDKMVFNAEKDVTSQSGSAADILKKVPQVSVDADGNVQLSGNSGIRFLINGKPSTAFGSSIADVLQAIPGSQIKSIEVITNPGAKYDAQGLGGIINIILKSSKAKGYNGSMSLSAGTRKESGSVNFNVRNNNFGANLFAGGFKRLKGSVPYYSERTTSTASGIDYLRQDGKSEFERHGTNFGAGFDWTVKKYNSISGNIGMDYFGNNGSGNTVQDLEVNKGGSIAPVITAIAASNKFKFRNTDVGLDYKRTFKKEDRELELAINSSFGNNFNRSFNQQSSLTNVPFYYSTENTNPGKTRNTEVTLDYSDPFGKNVNFGTGAKYSNYNINSNSVAQTFDPTVNAYVNDKNLSNRLNYDQNVYAAYAELTFPITKTISAKAGGRYERTEINAFFSNAQVQPNIPGYNTFVPSVYVAKKLTDKQTLKLSYSKRIERPDFNALNPYVNTTDPKNLSTGNPYLLPELGNRYELSYNSDLGKTGSFMVNVFYRTNKHDIQPYVVYYANYAVGDTVFNNVSVSTRQNIGTEKNTGLNIFGDLHPNTKLSLRGNFSLYYRHTINMIDKGYNTNSVNYRFNLNTSYQFTPTLLAEFFGNFNSARNEAQGRYPSFTTYNLAIRKQFWNKKGSLALTADNFLKNAVGQKTILTSPSLSYITYREIPFRSIGLNFSWKFGKLEFKKSKDDGGNSGDGGGGGL